VYEKPGAEAPGLKKRSTFQRFRGASQTVLRRSTSNDQKSSGERAPGNAHATPTMAESPIILATDYQREINTETSA
jgi:hypothetical protein